MSFSLNTNVSRELKKTWRERYKDAEFKIGELERKLQWCNAKIGEMLCAVTALGKYANLQPEEARKVVLDYMDAEDKRLAEKHQEAAKEELKARLARGEKIDFVDRREETGDAQQITD